MSRKHCNIVFHVLMTSCMVFMTSSDHKVTPKCAPEDESCFFSLTLRTTLSMTSLVPGDVTGHHRPLLIYPNGTRAVRMRTGCDDVMLVNESVSAAALTLDGTYRTLITVNGQMPGPAIVVYEGQEVVVNVTNDLLGQSVTLHWHGQHQMGTPWMDGTGGVSHCPISPGETFTYRFIAHPTGTFWYHSHEGVQRSEGAFGAFIVLPRPDSVQYKAEKKNYPEFSLDYHVTVQDFYRQSSLEVYHQWALELGRYTTGYDDLARCYDGRSNVDGYQSSYVKPRSILLNGKGWHYDQDSSTPENPGIPLQNFRVTKGKHYRFRVINAALALTLRLSVDSHVINVMATDGYGVKSRAVESVVIAPGERYDVWFNATDPDQSGLYWIRAEGIEWSTSAGDGKRVLPIHGEAILQYDHYSPPGGALVVPTSLRRKCTTEVPCTLLNCPYEFYPPEEHMFCLPVTSLEPILPDPPLTSPDSDDVIEKFLHLHYAGSVAPYNRMISSINSKQFQPPSAPPQIYPPGPWASRHGLMDFDEACDREVCPVTHVLRVPTGRIVQLVLMVMAHKDHAHPSSHPVHLHGHTFQVVRIGFPSYDRRSGRVVAQTRDTMCPDGEKTCGHPGWANSSWAGGRLPNVAASLVRKDTVAVPVGGYVVIRLETTNPGFWFLHCHMEFHNAQGMALILQEGDVTEMPPTPTGFRTCGDFSWSEREFRQSNKAGDNKDSFLADQASLKQYNLLPVSSPDVSSEALQMALGLTFTLLLAAVVGCVVLFIKLTRVRRGYALLPSGELDSPLKENARAMRGGDMPLSCRGNRAVSDSEKPEES